MASETPIVARTSMMSVKEEKKANTNHILAGLPDQNFPSIKQPTHAALGSNAASPLATTAIAGKKKARKGKTDGPVFGIQEKPMPMHDFKVLGSEKKPARTHINVTALSGGKVDMAQDIQKLTTPGKGAPAIAARKKFTLPNVPKEVRIATTQAVSFGSTFVVLPVGKDSTLETFSVHENILSARFQQFKDHLSSLLSEHGFKVIDLPDVDSQDFALYVQLLYTGHITSVTKSVVKYGPLSKLYILACNFDDVASQNAVLDAILSRAGEPFASPEVTLPRCEHVGIIYGGTEGPCAARRLMVDLYTSQASSELLLDTFPAEFMGELAISLMGVRKDGVVGVVKAENAYYEVGKVE